MHWLKRVNFHKVIIHAVLCIGGIILCFPLFGQKSSVLSSGKWYKLAITQSGIYKLDMDLLKKMGIDAASVNPLQLQIYGNGGKMLPQKNSVSRSKDLIQNAIWVKGEEDGKFDSNDAVYFYAEGPHVIAYDSLKATFQHQTNIYTDTSYYFLTVGNTNGLRIKPATTLTSVNGKIVNEFVDYWYHETESVNSLRSGRAWWGEYLGNTVGFSVQADLPGVIPSSPIKFTGSAMGSAQVNTKFLWKLNGQTVGESTLGTVGTGTYDIKGQQSQVALNATAEVLPSSSFSIGVNFDKNGQSSAQAYLNYIGVQVKRDLRAYEKQQVYNFLPDIKDTITYQIKNTTADWILWNITDPLHPVSIAVSGSSGSFNRADGKNLRRYVGFLPGQSYEPASWQPIANQNIAISEVPDLLIVTPELWKSEAQRLALFRKENDGLETLVVTTSQIYNEYASGKPDLSAIRDFARDLYLRNSGKLKYLLLFGDATYDYKNNLQNQSQSQRNGWVPVYESLESLNPVYTYSSDDYYGFMENQEGDWPESSSGDHTMDIGVGRLPVKSLSEARVVVDKLIRYSSYKRTMGKWRNTINFVADDGDGNVHQQHADQLAQLVNKEFLPSRIFLDAYPQITTSEGQKVPEVNAAINKSINEGTLILNYTGHGGVGGWAEEQVLTLADMLSARGNDNLSLLFTATCDFGRYDDPGLVSGAELMVLSPKGAAIGAVSTTRPVYSSTNFTLSKAFYEALIKSGSKTRIGDIFSETKNKALVGALNRNFALLGDPSMKLAKAEKHVRWFKEPDTLRALQKVNLELEIYNEDTITDKTFEGTARIVVYDKQLAFNTLGNEGDPQSYSEYSSKLFDGNVTVRSGKMSCEFVMPKDINYRTGLGRVSIYAVGTDSLADASGQLDIVVGGSAILIPDKTPPKITAYLNDPSFKNGDLVDNSPTLIVKLSDENGINVSKAGIGHDIILTLNDTLVIILNDYFTADLDSYKSGTIRYPFEYLPSGNYSILIKVWDTYTNFSEIAFGFHIGAANGIKLTDWKIYPNPFVHELSFELGHNRINEDIEVIFHLLLNTGQKVGSFKWQYYNSESVIRESVTSTPLGQLMIPLMLYIYTVEIKSLKDNSVDKRSGKIMRSP